MIVYPLEQKFGTELINKLRKIKDERLRRHVVFTKSDIDRVVIIGNGYPDNVIATIGCYHVNGDITVGMSKPSALRIGAICSLKTYLEKLKPNKFAVILDQEVDDLNDLHTKVEKNLRSLHINTKLEVNEDRLRAFRCKLGCRSFELIVIINGLDDVKTDQHSIEDHLIKVGLELGSIEDRSKYRSSKDAWESLDKDSQIKIFREILNNKKLFRKYFYQQYIGLELLKA